MPGHASHKDLVGLVVFSMTIAAAPGRRPPVLVVLLLRLLLLLRLIFTIVTFHVCHTASLYVVLMSSLTRCVHRAGSGKICVAWVEVGRGYMHQHQGKRVFFLS
jgi:hypothetical protein